MKKILTKKEQEARFLWKSGDVKVVKRSDSSWKRLGKAKDASRGK